MLERQSVFLALPIQQTEVEMRFGVVWSQLHRSHEELLGVIELALFEKDQSEVRVQDEYVRVLTRQAAVDHLGFGERIRFEVNETEEIENVGVVGAEFLRVLQLAARFGESTLMKRFATVVVMKEK